MSDSNPVRRDFLRTAAAASVAGIASRAWAQGNETIRVGLVGAGGRGCGAAIDALAADPAAKLVAVGDVFADQLERGLQRMAGDKDYGSRVDVPADRQFTDFDNYRKVIDQVDVVVLATPPWFRPEHLGYAVAKGVHSFVEKPVATDPATLRQCMAACETAKEKKLSMVSGLCWRYHPAVVATMQQVADGTIGTIEAIETNYCSGGVWEPRMAREAAPNAMEYQLRNWYYHTWLSGDHICEQAVHALDKMGWAMGDEPPVKCRAVGGRTVRTAERYGNIFDHFAVTYEYANGVRGYHTCRHWKSTPGFGGCYVIGSKGVCDIEGRRIVDRDGKAVWRYDGPDANMYRAEHVALFKSIRDGEARNDGLYMCRSTMLAIMGRMAAYTGQHLTWDQAMGAKETIGPETLAWGDVPDQPVAVPGRDKVV